MRVSASEATRRALAFSGRSVRTGAPRETVVDSRATVQKRVAAVV